MKVDKRKILELYDDGTGLSIRAIRDALGYSRNTISKVINQALDAGIDAKKLAKLDCGELNQLLGRPAKPSDYETPDFKYYRDQMDTYPDVNLKLCWHEYHRACAKKGSLPYMYSRFCDLYRAWAKKSGVTKRIVHKPGYCMQVDYAGSIGQVVDRITGEVTKAYFFVATFPYSGNIFSQATPDMKLASWIASNVHALRFFGGVPTIITPDNLKCGVVKPDPFEPAINDTYADMARHYGCCIVPTKIAYPKGKASVERAVQIVETWVIAYLRHRTFFTFAELNEAVAERIADLNAQIVVSKGISRDDLFEQSERAHLKALPQRDFEFAAKKTVKLSQDCHFQLEKMRYSAPYRYIGEELEVRITTNTVEAFYGGESICLHRRLVGRIGQYSTKEEHMPDHLRDANHTWSAEGFAKWAGKVGPDTQRCVEAICASRPIVEQAYRSCRGILALAKKKGNATVEKACTQALAATACPSYTQIRNIANTLEATPVVRRGADDLCQSRLGDGGIIRDPDSYTLRRED